LRKIVKYVKNLAPDEVYQNELTELVNSFATRYSGDYENTIELTNYIKDKFKSFGIPSKTGEEYDFGSSFSSRNVLARIPGARHPKYFVVAGAHLDSTSENKEIAPGAVDNGSGLAALLTCGRVAGELLKQGWRPDFTIIFVAFGGEEQGLHGSKYFVQNEILSFSDYDHLLGSVIMDMPGSSSDDSPGILLETKQTYENFVNAFSDVATRFGETAYESFNPFGSDHIPFFNAGLPAVLFIDNYWDRVECYHKSCDDLTTVAWERSSVYARIAIASVFQLSLYQTFIQI